MDQFPVTEFDPNTHPVNCACCMSWDVTVDPYPIADPYFDPLLGTDTLWTDAAPIGDPFATYPSAEPAIGFVDVSGVGSFETANPVQSPTADDAGESASSVDAAPALPADTGYIEVMPPFEPAVANPDDTGYIEVMPPLEPVVASPDDTGYIDVMPPFEPAVSASAQTGLIELVPPTYGDVDAGENTATIVIGAPIVPDGTTTISLNNGPALNEPLPDWAQGYWINLINAKPVGVDVEYIGNTNILLPGMLSTNRTLSNGL